MWSNKTIIEVCWMCLIVAFLAASEHSIIYPFVVIGACLLLGVVAALFKGRGEFRRLYKVLKTNRNEWHGPDWF